MDSDEQVHVGLWSLGVMKQVVASSDALEKTINIRTAKGTLSGSVHCIGLLDGGKEGYDKLTFEIRRKEKFSTR